MSKRRNYESFLYLPRKPLQEIWPTLRLEAVTTPAAANKVHSEFGVELLPVLVQLSTRDTILTSRQAATRRVRNYRSIDTRGAD